jgi:hypothetical protein
MHHVAAANQLNHNYYLKTRPSGEPRLFAPDQPTDTTKIRSLQHQAKDCINRRVVLHPLLALVGA